jgi:TRAP-type mannitol/chloroaromatic compound transport system substrate-binding protein
VTLKKFPDEVLNGLGSLAGVIVGDLADKDPLSRKVMDSIVSFRKDAITFAKASEQAFYNARQLPFDWVK